MRDLIHSEHIDDDEYRAVFGVVAGALCRPTYGKDLSDLCPSCGCHSSKDGLICDDCWGEESDVADMHDAEQERNDARRTFYNGEP